MENSVGYLVNVGDFFEQVFGDFQEEFVQFVLSVEYFFQIVFVYIGCYLRYYCMDQLNVVFIEGWFEVVLGKFYYFYCVCVREYYGYI